MSQSITLATADGVCSAPLFVTFDEEIQGTSYTFGVHRNLTCGMHHKLSEFSTGMGIAEVSELFVAPGQETPGASYDDLLLYGRQALQSVIQKHGMETVVDILTRNKELRPVLNTATVQ